jgi:dethiobiotin synthetase
LGGNQPSVTSTGIFVTGTDTGVGKTLVASGPMRMIVPMKMLRR